MLSRASRAASIFRHSGARQRIVSLVELYPFSRRYSRVPSAAAAAPASSPDSELKQPSSKLEVKLNSMFWSKPGSLTLPPGSPLRIEEPQYEGLRHIMLKLLLFYSKQSRSIRGANAVYRRIISQVDKRAIYDVFNLENTFKTTFSLLVLHMWLFLRRLKEEGKEGAEFGQYLYEIYNHDLELRVSKAGVNLLLIKWMKELEKIFYGNIVAYDDAMKPDSKHDELAKAIWRNIFSDDGTGPSNDAATTAVQAMSRYTRRESTCLSLTGLWQSCSFALERLQCQLYGSSAWCTRCRKGSSQCTYFAWNHRQIMLRRGSHPNGMGVAWLGSGAYCLQCCS